MTHLHALIGMVVYALTFLGSFLILGMAIGMALRSMFR